MTGRAFFYIHKLKYLCTKALVASYTTGVVKLFCNTYGQKIIINQLYCISCLNWGTITIVTMGMHDRKQSHLFIHIFMNRCGTALPLLQSEESLPGYRHENEENGNRVCFNENALPLRRMCDLCCKKQLHQTGSAKPVRYPHPCRRTAARFPVDMPPGLD